MDENTELKRYSAQARKSKSEPFVSCTIYAESMAEAVRWFGEHNYEIDGKVYCRGVRKD